VARTPTAVWLDSVDAIEGIPGRPGRELGLRDHLDEALRQQAAAGGELTVPVVLYDLPGRDCWRLVSYGEFGTDELSRYRTEYIDPIVEILGDPGYASLRIVVLVEPGALAGLVVHTGSRSDATVACDEMLANGGYRDGIRYALDALRPIANVYAYLDAAHHAVLGWEGNRTPFTTLAADLVASSAGGFDSVDGFFVNVAGYSATVEPYFTIDTVILGTSVRMSRWVDWNDHVDELGYAQGLRDQLVGEGFPESIGMVVDTSRNGWGGPARPGGPSTSSDVNTFVDASRIDRRFHAGYGWCNQAGAGLGEPPRAEPAPGIDAYAWVKLPGESDGSPTPSIIKGFDSWCDPSYTPPRGAVVHTGALPGAPDYGMWFSAQFRELLANAHPPL